MMSPICRQPRLTLRFMQAVLRRPFASVRRKTLAPERVLGVINAVRLSTEASSTEQTHDGSNRIFAIAAALGGAVAIVGGLYYYRGSVSAAESHVDLQERPPLTKKPVKVSGKKWPVYSRDEVSNHTTKKTGIWVTLILNSVYDITDIVDEHPGGSEKIMLAAGSGVEPFWDLYANHKESEDVRQMLEAAKIGILPEDEVESIDTANPYANDPYRYRELVILSKTPFNAETPHQRITESFETPIELFYVRNHLPVPEVDINTYTLNIECPDLKKSRKLTFDDLKTKFEPVTISATI